MSDFLLELGQNPTARKVIKGLGLPVPMPQKLRRADGPWAARPLQDQVIIVGAPAGAAFAPAIARTLASAGADASVVGDDGSFEAFADPGEAYGRPAERLDLLDLPDPDERGGPRPQGLVFDASSLTTPGSLRALYDFFHPLVRRLARCGRVVVLGRPPEEADHPDTAAAQAALEGFVRSVAKEVGRTGATANLIYVSEGAEPRLDGPLRFLLSAHSTFITGQPLRVTAVAAAAAASDDPTPWVRSLEGKVALVTGAARGIGAATARLLAGEGAKVVCLDRPQDDALTSQIAREIGGVPLLVDIVDASAPRAIATALAELGGVDVIVHNAGITRDKTLARMAPEKWEQTLDINLTAVTRITSELVEGTLKDGGRLIFLSSIAGIAGNMGQTNYAASKAGLIGYVRAGAKEAASRGITVNAIAPGFIETRLTAAIPVMIREAGRRLSALGQGGLPRDVGEAITFLATPESQGITGAVLRVCGGALVGA